MGERLFTRDITVRHNPVPPGWLRWGLDAGCYPRAQSSGCPPRAATAPGRTPPSPTTPHHAACHQGGEYRLRGSLQCDADASTVWRVLTDYDALPRVFSNVASAHVAQRSPELLIRQVGAEA